MSLAVWYIMLRLCVGMGTVGAQAPAVSVRETVEKIVPEIREVDLVNKVQTERYVRRAL